MADTLPTVPLMHSVEAAAERLGLGRTYTYDLIARGELPTVKVGRRRLVTESDLVDFVERLRGSEAS